jgi:hypothetical protein
MDKSKCAAMKPDHMAASGPLAISAAPQSCMEPPSPRVPIINACARADACACTRVSFLFFLALATFAEMRHAAAGFAAVVVRRRGPRGHPPGRIGTWAAPGVFHSLALNEECTLTLAACSAEKNLFFIKKSGALLFIKKERLHPKII